MANVLLVPSSQVCNEDFERLANRLREEEHSACVMTWPDRSTSRLKRECADKQLALVGIMGSPDELHAGFAAACVIASECRTSVLALCFDEPGYAFYTRHIDVPHSNRIRFIVLAGEPRSFPHAKSIVRLGGTRIYVENDWSHDELDRIVRTIGDESSRKVIAA